MKRFPSSCAMPSSKRSAQSFNQKNRSRQGPGRPFDLSMHPDEDFQRPPEVKPTADFKVQKRTSSTSKARKGQQQNQRNGKTTSITNGTSKGPGKDDEDEHFQPTSSKAKARNDNRKRQQDAPKVMNVNKGKKRKCQDEDREDTRSSQVSTQEEADKEEEIPSLLPKRSRVSNKSTLEEITKKKQEIDEIASGAKDKLPKKRKNKNRGMLCLQCRDETSHIL